MLKRTFLLFFLLQSWGSSQDLMVVVPQAFPINQLSRLELQNIYLGKKTMLEDGSGITPFLWQEETPYRQFLKEFLHKTPNQFISFWKQSIFTGQGIPPKATKDREELIRLLQQTPNSIGYLEEGPLPKGLKRLRIL